MSESKFNLELRLLDQKGNLVLCQHGDRRIARMDAPLDNPKAEFTSLGISYEGMWFNSPNDAVFHESGDLFLTDAPYGLENHMKDPSKEIPFQGVYRISPDGTVLLITDDLSRPNGIGLSPDHSTLYVANSDRENPVIMSYRLSEDGTAEVGEVFFDTRHLMGDGIKGLPDGLKVSKAGHLFATGPGGVLVISSTGKHLGTISTGEATSNCALDDNENYLYATSDMYLVRVALSSQGAKFVNPK